MEALLGRLAERDDVRLSLVTGNLEPIARLKLKRAGIGHWFASGQGGFGSDSEDRTDLPGIARRRAGHDREPHPQEHTVVIGDTPRDIACARADGVRVVAITTGPNTAAELQEADAVVDDVAGLEAALGYSDQ
jgi:phosphoglycolate phosphatase-like HAD superfamily hydrolase